LIDRDCPAGYAPHMDIPTFVLQDSITAEQREFLDEHGFIRFGGVLASGEVQRLRQALVEVQARFQEEARVKVHGIPLKWGRGADGAPYVNRFAFTSRYSQAFHELVHDARLDPVRRFIAPDARVGDREKDGVVVNVFRNEPGSRHARLGWHTDGLRDIFYGHMPKAMFNVGLYLDDSPTEKGGLRLIPGSHRQGLLGVLFRKLHFLDHRPDPSEVAITARAGDLTLHDGRLWHRTARAAVTGEASLRRVMYVPFVTGPRIEKTEASPTPLYHHLSGWVG
jgi:hypothetical protein